MRNPNSADHHSGIFDEVGPPSFLLRVDLAAQKAHQEALQIVSRELRNGQENEDFDWCYSSFIFNLFYQYWFRLKFLIITSVLYLIYFHQSYQIYCAILDRRFNPIFIISYIIYHYILRFHIFQSVWIFLHGPGVEINGSAPHWTGFWFWNCIPIVLHYQKIVFGQGDFVLKNLTTIFKNIQVNYCHSVYWEISI